MLIPQTLQSLVAVASLLLLPTVALQAQPNVLYINAITSDGAAVTGTVTNDGLGNANFIVAIGAPYSATCTGSALSTAVAVILGPCSSPTFPGSGLGINITPSTFQTGGPLVAGSAFVLPGGAGGVGVTGVISSTPPGGYQVRYGANLAIGDSVINFTNSGASSTSTGITGGGAQNGDICANVYAYSPDEQLVSCCSCNVTPNALNSLSMKNDLASNTLTPIIPSALVVKVLATAGGAQCTASSAASAGDATHPLMPGLLGWGTTIHALPVTAGSPATTYGLTETPFAAPSALTNAERSRMTQLCAFIRANGSGYGICKSCKVGGLGASAK